MKQSDHGAGAPSRRPACLRPEGGPTPFRHLAHVPSFRDNPIVFFTTCIYRRRKILASPQCHKILHEIWKRSADHDGWWIGNYILMPDYVHFLARPEIGARRMAAWLEMWKSVTSRRIAAVLSIKPPIWAGGLFRAISAIQRKLFGKVALRGAKRRSGRPRQEHRNLAVSLI
jgi:REP element-mobilizing transposase RayT